MSGWVELAGLVLLCLGLLLVVVGLTINGPERRPGASVPVGRHRARVERRRGLARARAAEPPDETASTGEAGPSGVARPTTLDAALAQVSPPGQVATTLAADPAKTPALAPPVTATLEGSAAISAEEQPEVSAAPAAPSVPVDPEAPPASAPDADTPVEPSVTSGAEGVPNTSDDSGPPEHLVAGQEEPDQPQIGEPSEPAEPEPALAPTTTPDDAPDPTKPATPTFAIITDPGADRTPLSDHVAAIAHILGWQSLLSTTGGSSSAAEQARSAVRADATTVVVLGGDDTLTQVAGALHGTATVLAAPEHSEAGQRCEPLLMSDTPAATADLTEFVQRILEGPTRPLTLGWVSIDPHLNPPGGGTIPPAVTSGSAATTDSATHTRPFLTSVSLGITEAPPISPLASAPAARPPLTKAAGPAALRLLRSARELRQTMTAMNLRFDLRLAEQVRAQGVTLQMPELGDPTTQEPGYLQVCVHGPLTAATAVATARQAVNGVAMPNLIQFHTAQHAELDAQTPLPLVVDGAALGSVSRIRVELEPQAVQVRL